MTGFYRFVYTVIAPFIRLFFPRRVVGLENLPEGGAVICPNHASFWDPFVVAVALPKNARLTVMAKEELFQIPLLGFLLRKLGVFPVKRGGSDLTAMKTALKALSEGNRLLIFPEGTRVEGQGETDAKGGAAVLAVRTKAPMIPVWCGPKHKLFRKTTVVFGEPYMPATAGRRPTAEESRRASEELLHRIYALSEVDGWK